MCSNDKFTLAIITPREEKKLVTHQKEKGKIITFAGSAGVGLIGIIQNGKFALLESKSSRLI